MKSHDEGLENTGFDLPHILDTPLTVPAKKLDADHYDADDIDGVTESIFGSGNLAYASLQAQQTDAAIALDDAAGLETEHMPGQDGGKSSGRVNRLEDTDSFNAREETALDAPTDTDRALDGGEITNTEALGTEGNFTGTTVGSLGASTLSSDAGSFAASSSLSLGGNRNDFNNSTGDSVTNNNVTNNTNVDDTVTNVVNTVNEIINNITNLGDELIENITNLGDDIVENILEGDITEITEILNNEITEITDILNAEINDITETVNNFLEETGITEITNQVINITNDVTENVTNIVNNVLEDVLGGGIGLDLNGDILDSLDTGLHVSVYDSITGNIGTDLVSDNLSSLTESLTGLNVSILAGTGVNIGFDLLGGANPNDGNDISIAGIDTPDIALDPVEAIVGDIDIEAELPAELLSDPGALIEDVAGLTGNLDDMALIDPNDILDILGSQSTEGALDVVLGDTELDKEFDTDIGNITDGIDDTVDEAMGLLETGGAGGDLIGDFTGGDGGNDDTSWTESILDAGGLFDDVINGIGGESDALPDPGGTVAEGIGALNVEPELDTDGLGGLFG